MCIETQMIRAQKKTHNSGLGLIEREREREAAYLGCKVA